MRRQVTYSRVVDLTHTIDPSIPLWPGDPDIVFDVAATIDKDGYYCAASRSASTARRT